MVGGSALGDYLRARREVVLPADVGLPGGVRRRVGGLRREEVALLAGISAEYYLRLEQGRDQHPSDQVLDSLASALLLDEEAVAYLHSLAHPVPEKRRRSGKAEKVSASVRDLICSWSGTPAYVQGKAMVVVAANPMAVALSPYFSPGVNPLRAAFLEPEMRSFYRDWEGMTAKVVPYLRSVVGADVEDPRLVTLIGELSLHSERFRALWARHDVRQKASGLTLLAHPVVGPLDLRYEKFVLPESGQVLITYHADPGSDSEERLRLLSSLAKAL